MSKNKKTDKKDEDHKILASAQRKLRESENYSAYLIKSIFITPVVAMAFWVVLSFTLTDSTLGRESSIFALFIDFFVLLEFLLILELMLAGNARNAVSKIISKRALKVADIYIRAGFVFLVLFLIITVVIMMN